jgi:hypothetical protein
MLLQQKILFFRLADRLRRLAKLYHRKHPEKEGEPKHTEFFYKI